MLLWGREMTFIENSPCASDLPTLISHLIFTQPSCRVSSSHSAPGETEDLQWRWVQSTEPIKGNNTEDSRDYFDGERIHIFRSNLFWSCQDLALNLLIPIGKALGWKQRRVYQDPQESVSKTHLTPLPYKAGQHRGRATQAPVSPDKG